MAWPRVASCCCGMATLRTGCIVCAVMFVVTGGLSLAVVLVPLLDMFVHGVVEDNRLVTPRVAPMPDPLLILMTCRLVAVLAGAGILLAGCFVKSEKGPRLLEAGTWLLGAVLLLDLLMLVRVLWHVWLGGCLIYVTAFVVHTYLWIVALSLAVPPDQPPAMLVTVVTEEEEADMAGNEERYLDAARLQHMYGGSGERSVA